MNRKEQKEFVVSLLANIEISVLNKIDDERIPENWDGIELRQYIADSVTSYRKMDKKRAREYRNTILVENL